MTLPARRRGLNLLTVTAAACAALCAGVMPANAQQPPPAAPSGAARAANKSPAKAAPTKEASNPKSEDSYSLGVSVGSELHQMGIAPAAVSPERILQGMRDALAGKAEMSQAHQQNIRRLLGAVGDANHEKAARFLANNAKKPGVLTTASGLQYQVLNAGSGESPRPSDEVSVNYRGALLDGTEFDSSYKRGGPASFQVNRVIPGWTEALQLMKPGAKFKLFIPPQLAYDLKSRPPIPPGSLLLFDVELLSVKTPPPAPAAQPLATPPAATPAEPKK